MTDKQIIIDGVDVSGCILRRRKEPNCTVCNGYSSKVFEFDCSDFKNCYYKQLKRKEQECEKLRGDFHDTNEQLNLKNEYIQKVKQECEKLKSQVDEDYNYYTTELKTLRDIISNKEKRNAALSLTSGRYHKALEEIEKDLKEAVYCESQECGCDDFEECLKCTKEHILDIINKAKKVKVAGK